MILKTSTHHAPWVIVEANDKLYARVKVLRTVDGRCAKASPAGERPSLDRPRLRLPGRVSPGSPRLRRLLRMHAMKRVLTISICLFALGSVAVLDRTPSAWRKGSR